jgi:hypothetical protein
LEKIKKTKTNKNKILKKKLKIKENLLKKKLKKSKNFLIVKLFKLKKKEKNIKNITLEKKTSSILEKKSTIELIEFVKEKIKKLPTKESFCLKNALEK